MMRGDLLLSPADTVVSFTGYSYNFKPSNTSFSGCYERSSVEFVTFYAETQDANMA